MRIKVGRSIGANLQTCSSSTSAINDTFCLSICFLEKSNQMRKHQPRRTRYGSTLRSKPAWPSANPFLIIVYLLHETCKGFTCIGIRACCL